MPFFLHYRSFIEPDCPGDLEFKDIDYLNNLDFTLQSCEPICGEKVPSPCFTERVLWVQPACGCPDGLYRSSESGAKCYKKEDCPIIGKKLVVKKSDGIKDIAGFVL